MDLDDILARAGAFEALTNPIPSILEEVHRASRMERIAFHAERDAMELMTKHINPTLGSDWATEMLRHYRSAYASAQTGSLSESFMSGLAIARREGRADMLKAVLGKIDSQWSATFALSALREAISTSAVDELRQFADRVGVASFAEHLHTKSVSELLKSAALEHTHVSALAFDKWLSKTLSSGAIAALTESSLGDVWAELKARETVAATYENLSSEFAAKGRATASFISTTKLQDGVHESRRLQKLPTGILLLIVFIWQMLISWEDARNGLVDINARLPRTESFFELRQFIQSELGGRPGDFRMITGANVNLREAPAIKSDILLTMPKYAVVLVSGKEDRTWLLVSYEHQGVWVEGYVSTKFLKKAKRER